MVNQIFFRVTESMDGGYEAQAVGHSIYTQFEHYNDLGETLKDAVYCHFDEGEMPRLIVIAGLARNPIKIAE